MCFEIWFVIYISKYRNYGNLKIIVFLKYTSNMLSNIDNINIFFYFFKVFPDFKIVFKMFLN
jgi:hypothetical protein